ncbi:MAG: hypothetical protein ACREAW_00430 [Nitrososphaera sp.]
MMITRAGLTYYRFISLPVAIGLLLPSLFIPWVTINFLGSSLFSPLYIIRVFFLQGAGDGDQNLFDLYDLMTSYNDTFSASVASIGSLVASVAIMPSGIMLRAHRPRLVLVAGCLAVASCVFWLYSIESLKSNFSHQAAITGGIVGEEFRGHERALADIIIGVGLGPYLALAAGIGGIMYRIIGTASAKR